MYRSLIVITMVALLGLIPVATSCTVKRALSTTFNTPDGRKAVDAHVRGLVAMLGPRFAASMSLPMARGLNVDFPVVTLTRDGKPWLDLRRGKLEIRIWPHILKGDLGVRLRVHDAATGAAAELAASPNFSVLLGDDGIENHELTVAVRASELKLTTLLEAFGVDLGGGVLQLGPNCCTATLAIEGTTHHSSEGQDSASLQVLVRHSRIRLPRQLGVIRFRDLVLPVDFSEEGWSLRKAVVAAAEGKALRLTLAKPTEAEPLRAQIDGDSSLVQIAALAGSCPVTMPLKLVWRAGQGWAC